jgi:Domain of unknown function (DUF5753)
MEAGPGWRTGPAGAEGTGGGFRPVKSFARAAGRTGAGRPSGAGWRGAHPAPTVTFQVVPLAIAGYTGLDGSFALLDFRRNPSVVHLEHKIAGLFLDQPEQVAFFRREVAELTEVTLTVAESLDAVARIATEYERE